MLNSLSYTIVSLIYLLILIGVYGLKKKIKSQENKIYSIILSVTLLSLILELISYALLKYNINLQEYQYLISNKFILISYIIWQYLFTFYVAYISTKNYENKSKKLMSFKYMLITILVASCILIVFLPINIVEIDDLFIPSGISVNITYILSGVCIFLIILFLLLDKKNYNDKKYIPLYCLIVFGSACVVIQYYNPQLLLLTPVKVIICYMMYFTIENPDMAMIGQLNEARTQAEKANNAKSDFLSNMSHEIRTPLNAIVGFSQALSEEDIPVSAKEEVNDIISASESLLDIVNGILDISKIEANKLEIIDKEYSFKKIFDELVALTKARMGDKPLDFRYHYDESIQQVLYGDNVRVKQVILNLLTNSVKYTKNGFVDFKINSIIKDDICRLIISVEDSGIGIKKENIEKLFTKFERFDEKNTTIEGTGLGLAITKKLVNLMNGKIVVQSVYGKGSRFTVAIDQKIVKDKTLDDIQSKTTEEFVDFDATGMKILVVDDNKLNLKVASRLLLTYKSEIITIDNGFECIERINNGEKFDLILMDDMMPKMSGVETLHKLKENQNYNIPTIALTANAIEGMRDKYMSEGFDDYLSKPINKLELNKVINKFLNKK